VNQLKVLVIEDEIADKERLIQAFDSLKGIFYKHSYSWTDAKEKLATEVFDLVIADLFIFKDGRKEGELGEFFCLDAVLEITEDKNPPIPVVVYTGRETLKSLEEYSNRIIDFWDKREVKDVYYLEFRMRKIREMFERERPSAVFIKKIRDGIQATEANSLPWSTDIQAILSGYESYGSIKDQALSVLTPLSKIADDIGCEKSFRNAYDVTLSVDAPISSLLASRPHLHHSINTFLLGFYIINLSKIDWQSLIMSGNSPFVTRYNEEQTHNGKDEASAWFSKELNSAWFIASMLHDCGMIVQKYTKVSGKIREIVNSLKITAPLVVNEETVKVNEEKAKHTKNEILRNSLPNISDYLEGRIATHDHGIMSAIYILNECNKEIVTNGGKSSVGIIAAEAVALHNFSTDGSFPVLELANSPIASLLLICDAFQSWKRDLYVPSVFEGDLLGRVDLCKLDTTIDDKGHSTLNMSIRYLTSSMLANHRHSLDQCEASLVKIIQEQVKAPIRQRIKQNPSAPVKVGINFEFFLGYKRIEKLVIPVM